MNYKTTKNQIITYRRKRLLLFTRFIIVFITAIFNSLHAASQPAGMKEKVTLEFKMTDAATVIKELDKQTSYSFSYSQVQLSPIQIININFKQVPFDDVLKQLEDNYGFVFAVLNKTISVKIQSKPALAQPVFKVVPQQPGRISGKIVDDKGESLSGATVHIIELNTSAASAIDGTYNMNAAPGNYTVEVSYVSFQTKRITDVVVKAGSLTKLDVILLTSSNALNAVLITSSYKKESAAGLYAQQKNAASVTDGISAEQIARTPDNNMGQVLKRVSGVSTVDNRYIVVRGLTERYNQGMIDGITLPSTDMNRRNFAFDVIPVEMVSNVVVNKTATPDVSAEFAGGQVSVNTLDIPVENFTVLSLGTGFNSNVLGKNFVESGKRGKYDFFGFDDGHRKLPAGIQSWGSVAPPDYAVSQSKLFSPDAFKRYTSTGGANQNYRFSLGRTYDLKNDQKIGFVAGLSLRNSQETNQFQDVRGFEGSYSYPVAGPNYIDSANRRRNGYIYKYNTTIGAQLNAGIQGKNYKIGFKNLYSQIFNNILNTSTGMLATVGFDNDDARTQQNLQTPEITRVLQHKLEGEYKLTNAGLKLTWLGGITTVRQEVKDRTKFTYRLTGRTDDGTEYYQTPAVVNPSQNSPDYDYRLFTDTKETDYNWGANLSQPFNFLGDKSLIKGGYSGIYKKRALSATTLKIRTEDRDFNAFDRPYEEVLAPENIGTGEHSNQAYYLADGNNGSQFDGTSKFHAFYLMLDQRFLKKIRIVYGVRGENYELQNKQPLVPEKTSLRTVTGEKNTTYLPSANLTYSITSKMNFRASFAKTVIRPDFRETSYFGYYDPFLNAEIVGDDVVSTKIKNSDLRYEWYPSAGELVSVSGFYKSFDKPIELVVDQDPTGKVTRYRYQNQKDAVNYGLEFEFRKSLSFIDGREWLRNLTLFGNGTIIKSKVHTLSTIGNGSIVENQETRALYGQSPYTANAGISYSSSDYGLTVSYNRSGRRTYTISSNPNLTEYENGRNLFDMQLYGRLLKQKLEIKLNVANLLNSTSFYYINANGYKQESGTSHYVPSYGKDSYEKEYDLIRYRINYGITPSLNVTYKF